MNRRLCALLVAAMVIPVLPAAAKDVYKCCLDPANPNHKAILDTLEKLKTAPNDAALHNDLGCLVARDGFWRDALREMDEAARLAPKDGRPSFNAGIVRLYMGDPSGAARSFKRSVKRDPGNWPGWWMLGFAREMQGELDAALDAYKTSLRVDTSLFDPRLNPFAAQTRMKGLALLETYPRRLTLTAMTPTQQLADPVRVQNLLRPMRPAPATPENAAPGVEAAPAVTRSGPVVTQSPAGGSPSSPSSASAVQPSMGGPATTFKPVPSRGEVRPGPVEREGARRYPPEGQAQEKPGAPGAQKPVRTPPPPGPGGGE